jgi:tetratricopeptide (TPR) repeat protein
MTVMFVMTSIVTTMFICCLSITPGHANGTNKAWEVGLPMPTYDPLWEKAKALWDKHWDGKNLGELIDVCTTLKNKYPDRIEPYIWLGKAHNLHGWHNRSGRKEHFKTSEELMLKALKIDPNNVAAKKIFIEALAFTSDSKYVWSKYGKFIRSMAPLPIGEALVDLDYIPAWPDFMKLWKQRADYEKCKEAIAMLERFATERPKDGLAQLWAARANYYLGECYTSYGMEEHNTKAMPLYEKGYAYAKKAVALIPNSVPAHYYVQLNMSRIVQFKSKPQQALKLNELISNLIFCARENMNFLFCGPLITLGTMITNGGWVAEKGMNMAGVTIDIDLLGVEMMEVMYPDYYYFPFVKADMLRYKGKKKEALAVLEKLIARNPDNNLTLIPENRSFIRYAKILYNEMKNN